MRLLDAAYDYAADSEEPSNVEEPNTCTDIAGYQETSYVDSRIFVGDGLNVHITWIQNVLQMPLKWNWVPPFKEFPTTSL